MTKPDTESSNNLVLFPVFLAISFVAGILISINLNTSKPKSANDISKQVNKVNEVLGYIDKDYVDDVSLNKVIEDAIEATVRKLDPHSSYIPKSEMDDVAMQLESKYDGIGIEFNIIKDTLIVVAPLSGGPSERLGILHGDKIVNIDGENVAGIGLNNQKVFDLLRGPKGSIVNVKILRASLNDPLEFEIKRDEIPSFSVESAYMINDNMGYIKISRFTGNTGREFDEKIQLLKLKGLTKLILDLRNNAGGHLSAALQVADQFIEQEKQILYTKGNNAENNFDFKAQFSGKFERGDVVVLINEGSASASEIVAGALQDQDRALILGRRSFGKGLVQAPIMLSDSSELRLTISRYYIPSGRSIQKPYDDDRQSYAMDLLERYRRGEYFEADSIKFSDSLKYETASGRTVYGGGGIMPDIFIPRDTSYFSAYLYKLNSKALLNDLAFEYANAHRSQLESMSINDFVADFNVDNDLITKLISNAKRRNVNFDSEGFKKSQPFIKTQLKSLIARNIWRDNGFYQVFNTADKEFQEALEVLENGIDNYFVN